MSNAASPPDSQHGTAFRILAAISFCHLLNDMIQSLLPASYPMLAKTFSLDFGQVGLITFTWQITASLLQPMVGLYTDRHPKPYSLAIGMTFTLVGLVLLSLAPAFHVLLLSAALIGMGSSVFHPESSRVARMASGGRHGLAQSLFQVGGNLGSALGPLLAAFLILPHGQGSVAWVSLAALLAIAVLSQVGRWYGARRKAIAKAGAVLAALSPVPGRKVAITLGVLLLLIFSKFFYMASISSYYTFYLIDRFHVSVQTAQMYLFLFSGSVAVGTIAGGPIGDRFGRKYVIWFSILGVLPFTLALPSADLFWTAALSVPIGLILSSAFSAIVVYGQELMPGKVGLTSGLFFGFGFGIGGLGAAVLGKVADVTSIEYVYRLCSFLPAIGLLTVFLPNLERHKRAAATQGPVLAAVPEPAAD